MCSIISVRVSGYVYTSKDQVTNLRHKTDTRSLHDLIESSRTHYAFNYTRNVSFMLTSIFCFLVHYLPCTIIGQCGIVWLSYFDITCWMKEMVIVSLWFDILVKCKWSTVLRTCPWN